MNFYQRQSIGLKNTIMDEREKAFLEPNIKSILDLLIKEDRLLPNSNYFISILERLKVLDKKQNRFNHDDIVFLNNLDSKFKSILENKDMPIKVNIHTNLVEKKVMYEVLGEPFNRDIKGFRGAFYNCAEIIK